MHVKIDARGTSHSRGALQGFRSIRIRCRAETRLYNAPKVDTEAASEPKHSSPPPPAPKPEPRRSSTPYPTIMPPRRAPKFGKLTRADAASASAHPMRRSQTPTRPSRVGKMSRLDPPSDRSIRSGRASVRPRYYSHAADTPAPATNGAKPPSAVKDPVELPHSTPWLSDAELALLLSGELAKETSTLPRAEDDFAPAETLTLMHPVPSIAEAVIQRAFFSTFGPDRPVPGKGAFGAAPSGASKASASRRESTSPKAADSESVAEQDALAQPSQRWQLPIVVGSVALLLGFNRLLTDLFQRAAIQFPAPIAGMVLISTALTLANRLPGRIGDKVYAFFTPTLYWVARWMPIFFVAPLVVLPLAMQGIALAVVAKLGGVLAVGWMASILVAATTVDLARGTAHTELTEQEVKDTSPTPLLPFSGWQLVACSAIVVSSGLLVSMLGDKHTGLGVIFTLSSTINGYILGTALPKAVKKVLHPLVVCTLFAGAACAIWGSFVGVGFHDALRFYLQSGPGAFGAGNILLAFLPVVVLCDGFRIYSQRQIIRRHLSEILATVLVCATFSLFATAFAAAALGLDPSVGRALISRSITTPLAIPMAMTLDASMSLTAAFVCVTGLLGAAAGQPILNAIGARDEIRRGVAQAASSHALGAAAFAESEPQALPFSAVTIAAMGIVSNLLVSVPAVRGALLAIIG